MNMKNLFVGGKVMFYKVVVRDGRHMNREALKNLLQQIWPHDVNWQRRLVKGAKGANRLYWIGTKMMEEKFNNLVLYGHKDSPYCVRVEWVLRSLSLPYRFEHVQVGKRTTYTDGFLSASPTEQVPALSWSTGSLFDSAACVGYLDETFGFILSHPDSFKRHRLWALSNYVSSQIGEPLGRLCWQRFWKKKFNLECDETYCQRLEKALFPELDKLEKIAQRAPLWGGETSILEVMAIPLVALYRRAEVDITSYKSVHQWFCEAQKDSVFKALGYLPKEEH